MSIDGIPVGTIRSNIADTKVTSEEWCMIFGHKMIGDKEGNIYCKSCYKTLDELNKETYGKIKGQTGNTGE